MPSVCTLKRGSAATASSPSASAAPSSRERMHLYDPGGCAPAAGGAGTIGRYSAGCCHWPRRGHAPSSTPRASRERPRALSLARTAPLPDAESSM
eukprot:6886701-Prymnesium_polylepis.1